MKMELVADLLEELVVADPTLDTGKVHINEMPMQTKHGVLLLDTYAGTQIDPYIPKLRYGGLRLVVRSPAYVRGFRTANRLVDTLTTFKSRNVTGRHLRFLYESEAGINLRQVMVMNEPKPYRSSEGGYVEFELDVELIYEAP